MLTAKLPSRVRAGMASIRRPALANPMKRPLPRSTGYRIVCPRCGGPDTPFLELSDLTLRCHECPPPLDSRPITADDFEPGDPGVRAFYRWLDLARIGL